MTLASILFVGMLIAPPGSGDVTRGWTHQSQSTPDQPAATVKQTQTPGNAPGTGTAQESGAKARANTPQSSASQAKPSKKTKRKKDLPVNCNTAASKNAAPKGTSANPGGPTKKSASSRCPPTKVIVQQGSATEPSIQVVGGAEGSQASDERNTAIQMLETTESNLKKIEETQLDSNQQDIVKQVHQFMDQSKAASSSGDLDQARTLAWKAQLLSEELLKPQK